jgi:hypothetical protein
MKKYKELIRAIILFCKENKELVKGIVFGVLFMSLAYCGVVLNCTTLLNTASHYA